MKNKVFALIFLLWAALLNAAPTFAASEKVQIFVTSWCPYCQALEKFLTMHGIPYKRYDIEHDSEGARRHALMGGGGVPVIKVEGTTLRGFDPLALIQTLKSYHLWPKNPPQQGYKPQGAKQTAWPSPPSLRGERGGSSPDDQLRAL